MELTKAKQVLVQQLTGMAGDENLQSVLADMAEDILSKLSDAPVDGKQYARKNASWAEVISGGGGGDLVKLDLISEDEPPEDMLLPHLFPSETTSYFGSTYTLIETPYHSFSGNGIYLHSYFSEDGSYQALFTLGSGSYLRMVGKNGSTWEATPWIDIGGTTFYAESTIDPNITYTNYTYASYIISVHSLGTVEVIVDGETIAIWSPFGGEDNHTFSFSVPVEGTFSIESTGTINITKAVRIY